MRWEYCIVNLPVQPYVKDGHTVTVASVLNDYGAAGWEAYHVHEYVAFVKRQVVIPEGR